MEHWELALLNIGSILFMAIMAFFMKRIIAQIDKRLEQGDERFKEFSLIVADLKEKRGFDREYIAKEYVAKDDFIRDARAIDFKIDVVIRDVKKLLVLTGGKGESHAGS
jgi:hypothetical protein